MSNILNETHSDKSEEVTEITSEIIVNEENLEKIVEAVNESAETIEATETTTNEELVVDEEMNFYVKEALKKLQMKTLEKILTKQGIRFMYKNKIPMIRYIGKDWEELTEEQIKEFLSE